MPYIESPNELASDLAMICLLSEHERDRSGMLRTQARQARQTPAVTSTAENPAKLEGAVLFQQARQLRQDSQHLCEIASETKKRSASLLEESKSRRHSRSQSK